MHQRIRTTLVLVFAVLAAVAVSACGSSSNSGDAKTLLHQTFSGAHPVNSGTLNFSLTLTPSGSSTLTKPISISFGGPFQSLGKGKLPKSNFNIALSSGGQSGSLGLLSTGTSGYVTLQGTSYALPAATFQKLESSFSQLESSPGGSSSSNSGALAKLGIHPLDWLSNPSVVGTESMGGTDTTHIRANVDVAALLADVNTFLQKASTVGVSGTSQVASSLSPTTRQKIASEVKNPTFDVWTGKSDKTVRRLTISLNLPVSGQVSTQLGGMSSAGLALSMQYANLNQPQTITAPTNVHPYSEFSSKLQSFLQSIQGTLGTTTSGTGTTTGGTGTTTGGTGTTTSPAAPSTTSTTPPATGAAGSSAAVQRYSQCIVNAKNDVTKMQQCASLINGQ